MGKQKQKDSKLGTCLQTKGKNPEGTPVQEQLQVSTGALDLPAAAGTAEGLPSREEPVAAPDHPQPDGGSRRRPKGATKAVFIE